MDVVVGQRFELALTERGHRASGTEIDESSAVEVFAPAFPREMASEFVGRFGGGAVERGPDGLMATVADFEKVGTSARHQVLGTKITPAISTSESTEYDENHGIKHQKKSFLLS